ncbi:MAG: hypothetical protein EBY17_27290, partial [Acidobacteriia bacterium]|nr:hypothetical protein [Terriglobia bacterium]
NCTFSQNTALGGTGNPGDPSLGLGGDGGGNNPGHGVTQVGPGADGGFGGGGAGMSYNYNATGLRGGGSAFGGGKGGGSYSDGSIWGDGGWGCGGGVFVVDAEMALVNCTIVSNTVSGGTGNHPGRSLGGGIYSLRTAGGNVVTLLNTLIGDNAPGTDLLGTNFSSTGFNLIGNSHGAAGLSINDFQNEPPEIGPLQDNGGGTLTHALLFNSLAVIGGSTIGAPVVDQRGVPRPPGRVDIGAFQFSTDPINITTQPKGQSFVLGDAVTFTVGTSGTGLTYQWQFNGTNIPGATTPTLNLSNLAATNAGAYRVVVSSSAGGFTTSQNANLLYFGDLKLYSGATLGGPVGQQFRVDYADMVNVGTTNWLVLSNVTLPSSPYLVIDPGSPGQPKRFYRAVPLP